MTRDAPYESEAFGDPSHGHLCRLTLQLLCSSEALESGLGDNRGTRCTDIFSSLHPSPFPNGELGFLGKKLHSLRKMEIYRYFFSFLQQIQQKCSCFHSLEYRIDHSVHPQGEITK